MTEQPRQIAPVTRIIRCTDDLLEAFAARKAELELSNEFVDDVGGLTRGHCDKVLGPTRAKRISQMTLDLFLEIFAVELVIRPNLEALARMEARWEQRKPDRVRLEPNRVSAKIVERATPHVLKELSARGNAARKLLLPGTEQREIALKASRARARLPKAMRSEISRKGWLTRAKNRKCFSPAQS